MSLVVEPAPAIHWLSMGIIHRKAKEQPIEPRTRQDVIEELRALVASLHAKHD